MKLPPEKRVLKTDTEDTCKENGIPEKASSALTDDEKIDLAASFMLTRYRSAFEELAK